MMSWRRSKTLFYPFESHHWCFSFSTDCVLILCQWFLFCPTFRNNIFYLNLGNSVSFKGDGRIILQIINSFYSSEKQLLCGRIVPKLVLIRFEIGSEYRSDFNDFIKRMQLYVIHYTFRVQTAVINICVNNDLSSTIRIVLNSITDSDNDVILRGVRQVRRPSLFHASYQHRIIRLWRRRSRVLEIVITITVASCSAIRKSSYFSERERTDPIERDGGARVTLYECVRTRGRVCLPANTDVYIFFGIFPERINIWTATDTRIGADALGHGNREREKGKRYNTYKASVGRRGGGRRKGTMNTALREWPGFIRSTTHTVHNVCTCVYIRTLT